MSMGAQAASTLVFQLTTSRRGRLIPITFIIFLMSFQLTTSRRGRRQIIPEINPEGLFQLTTSRRGRPFSQYFHLHSTHFNSLPHAEVDRFTC